MFNRTSLHIALLLWGCIFSLIAALCMFMSKNFDRDKRSSMLWLQLCCALLLLSDALAWGYRGNQSSMGYYMVRISNFLVFELSDILLFLFHGYVCLYLFGSRLRKECEDTSSKIKKIRKVYPVVRVKVVYLIAMLGMGMVVVSQFTHWYYSIDPHNYYHRNAGHIISLMLPMVGMLIDLSLLIQFRGRLSKRIFVSMLSYMLLPFVSTLALVFYYGISLTNLSISIALILMFVTAMMEQNENLARKEKEAADMRISVMLSQITPHFIYNTLSSIKHLCMTDPEMAAETVEEFAEYLRGNLDALSEAEMIPFEREWHHVCSYLAIEQKRFGDRVRVESEILEKDFVLPALTLQPIVENAVKHGICKKQGGGVITIKTWRQNGEVLILVSDDGVGFDTVKTSETGQNHVGLTNVRDRLESMCGGSLIVTSETGRGTKVMIHLPIREGDQ